MRRWRGVFEHPRFEGNMAEVVAHEVVHFHSVRAEYQANVVYTGREGLDGFARRVGLLLNDACWGSSS